MKLIFIKNLFFKTFNQFYFSNYFRFYIKGLWNHYLGIMSPSKKHTCPPLIVTTNKKLSVYCASSKGYKFPGFKKSSLVFDMNKITVI